MKRDFYQIPELQINEFVTDRGFASSIEDPIVKPEEEW
jgi:hypothetical protein